MTELFKYFERDVLSGGRFQSTIGLKPRAFLKNGSYARIVSNFVDGDVNFPHVISEADFFSYITPQGDWRVHPTRDPNVWFSVGAPFTNPASPVRATLNAFTRSGNTLTSVNANFDARIIHAGHYLKLEFQLKNGFVPPQSKVAFPLDAQGVTRVGSALQVGGVTVMNLTAPVVYDAANRDDVRPIAVAFQSVSGQLYAVYTLPSLTGMSAPVVDPTLSLQPDATAGIDNVIADNATTSNFGTLNTVGIGESDISSTIHRTLIKFDLSSIANTATISSSILSLFATAENSSNARTSRMYRQLRAWTELGSTWNKYDGVSNWGTAGGFGVADCEQSDIGSHDFGASDTLNQFYDWVLTASKVQEWVSGALTNNGLLGKTDTEANDRYTFASSDDTTAANRPQLVVVYTLPIQNMVRAPTWGTF